MKIDLCDYAELRRRVGKLTRYDRRSFGLPLPSDGSHDELVMLDAVLAIIEELEREQKLIPASLREHDKIIPIDDSADPWVDD